LLVLVSKPQLRPVSVPGKVEDSKLIAELEIMLVVVDHAFGRRSSSAIWNAPGRPRSSIAPA